MGLAAWQDLSSLRLVEVSLCPVLMVCNLFGRTNSIWDWQHGRTSARYGWWQCHFGAFSPHGNVLMVCLFCFMLTRGTQSRYILHAFLTVQLLP